MKSDPLEKDIEAKIVAHAKSKRVLVYKFTSPSRRSVPDRLFIAPKGRAFFIEVKRAKGKLSPGQEVEIAKLRAQNIYVGVAYSVDEGKRMVDEQYREDLMGEF